MKKIISFALAVLLVVTGTVGSFALIQFPVDIKGEISDYPVVFVPGYGGAWLMLGDDPETAIPAWNGVTFDDLLSNVLNRIGEVALAIGAMPFDNADRIARIAAEELKHTWPYIACNPDGTSVYDLKPYYTGAAETNDKYIHENDTEYMLYEREISAMLANYIDEENIFNFSPDFRLGAEYNADRLNEYIQSVKEFTGKDKVNIFGLSHGGQVTATYLALYGDRGDVDNAVLSSPAIGGAALAYDLLSGNAHLDEVTLIKMIEVGFFKEETYEWLVKAINLGFIDDIFNALVPYLADTMGYWPSIWDFVPVEHYEEMKEKYLSDPACAPLIEQSDRFHYEILPTMGEKFNELNANGSHISIITGCGDPAVSGSQINSDAIIPVNSATGATCAPYGERFPDGYKQINDCSGKYKVSPAMDIDASTCYLPDATWFADGNFHAWTYWTPATRSLTFELLMTDRITDVYSDPDFPQFITSDHISYHIDFNFDSDVPGYLDSGCNSVTIRNTCDEGTITVTSLYCKEAPLAFNLNAGLTLKPGEKKTIAFTGGIPDEGPACLHLTACYTFDGVMPLNLRTKGFTVLSQNVLPEADETVKDNPTPFPDALLNVLQKLGLTDFFSLFAMQIAALLRTVFSLIKI